MKKFFFCVSLVLTGLMTACVDKNEVVDADSKPSWLGESIYQELKNPKQLNGTFSTYLKLVDDLGYSEILARTGSKTVFPANDDAFERFFASNDWGVSSYADLSDAQKKLLLYSSMLDNALLVSMFSNVSSSSTSVTNGIAMKHQTSVSLIDTIQHITSASLMPRFNKYWDPYRQDANIYTVSDATRPMLVHFTREHMLNYNITTLGENSDFAILTGTPYEDGMAYIFGDQIVKNDVTCQNGYIHQMKDVIVPPGNMAQVVRADEETNYFSQVLDYYCAPYKNQALTDTYNAWAEQNGRPTIDMIYEVRYQNNQQVHRLNTDPDGNIVNELLAFDPGWNQYNNDQGTSTLDMSISDIAAMFVPNDKAFTDFFCEGGDGAYLIDLYGKYTGSENTPAHLAENLDSLRSQRPDILTKFMNNLMSKSFVETVPSKFSTILSDASEYKGISTDILDTKSDGKYDIKFANNGVVYKMTEMIAPDEFQSVMAPSSVYPDMHVMDWAVQDDSKLRVSFHYYLMAMRANYAFFIPDDKAFEAYYVDPVYLKHDQPRVLKFYYDAKYPAQPVRCIAYAYNPETNEVGETLNNGANVDVAEWSSQMIDIMNYHTVVLDDGEVLGTNKYYKTKHGGAVMLTGVGEGQQVLSGRQIDNGMEPSTITKVYPEKNGTAFRIDHIIAAPTNSVSKTLRSNDRFSEFNRVCAGFSNARLLRWAGIRDSANDLGIREQDSYIIYTTSLNGIDGCSLDDEGGNVKMFNTYNYTLYAPNNEAMQKAYAAGLPSWDDINKLMADATNNGIEGDELQRMKDEAKEKIDILRAFARYHFQNTSVYADNKVASSKYNSLMTDDLGLSLELKVSGGGGKLYVTDGAGQTHTIDAGDPSRLTNLMARDYWLDGNRAYARSIYTSSFCVVHEITEPLNSGDLGLSWARRAGSKAFAKK
jgi:uncharacterized surface protein with fasciclin (FAS1) repeats